MEEMARRSRFGGGEYREDQIGFELRLTKAAEPYGHELAGRHDDDEPAVLAPRLGETRGTVFVGPLRRADTPRRSSADCDGWGLPCNVRCRGPERT